MIPEDEKTPSVVAIDSRISTSPRATPLPRLKPPPGRPPGALSISELVEQVTQHVRERADAELERAQCALRDELAAEIRTATGLGILAIAMNAVAVFAVLAFAHVLPGRLLAVVFAGLTILFVAFATSRRAEPSRPIVTRPASVTGRH